MRRPTLALALALALAACAAPEVDDAPTGAGPLIGAKPNGTLTDEADRSCGVILRTFQRKDNGVGGFVAKDGYWVWVATVDVKKSLGGAAEVLYRPNKTGSFYLFSGKPIDGGGADYQRYTVEVNARTTPTPLMDLRSWEYQSAELAVYAHTATSRLFDHNRVSSDFANYDLLPSNTFAIADAPGVCPTEKPLGKVVFGGTGAPIQHGPLAVGGNVTIEYPIERMTKCRYSSAGAQLWDIEANIKFEPSGQLLTQPVTQVVTAGGTGPTRVAKPLSFDVPLGTQRIQAWFRNFNGGGSTCEDYDSLGGQNYQLVVAAPAAPVGWAGDWGNGMSRACEHLSGLAEPVVIDGYIRERACTFIDADVYVPGLTDQDNANVGQLWAQVEYSYDSGPVLTDWLLPQGRVGNNQRYRWNLPYEFRMAARSFTQGHFAFRFSNDGVHFFRVGQADGPGGGAARTLNEAP